MAIRKYHSSPTKISNRILIVLSQHLIFVSDGLAVGFDVESTALPFNAYTPVSVYTSSITKYITIQLWGGLNLNWLSSSSDSSDSSDPSEATSVSLPSF